MKKEKVYCKNCRYLKRAMFLNGDLICSHSINQKEKNTWYESGYVLKRDPQQINSKNGCKWFESKETAV